MRHIYLALILVLILVSACGLRRTNPIDPLADHNEEFYVPDPVTNIAVTVSGAGLQFKTVEFRWTPNSNTTTDGYYIKRGMAYNALYAVVDTLLTNTPDQTDHLIHAIHGSKPWHSVLPGDYYYKISAWKQYGDRRLEGRESSHIFVRVPAK